MFAIITNRKSCVPRKSLYCAWIRAAEGESAPLIRVWIDPSMTMFESQVQVQQSDIESALAGIEGALSEGSGS